MKSIIQTIWQKDRMEVRWVGQDGKAGERLLPERYSAHKLGKLWCVSERSGNFAMAGDSDVIVSALLAGAPESLAWAMKEADSNPLNASLCLPGGWGIWRTDRGFRFSLWGEPLYVGTLAEIEEVAGWLVMRMTIGEQTQTDGD